MPTKKRKLMFVLNEDLEIALREHAARETISASAVVRQALTAFFAARNVTVTSPTANGHSLSSDSAA